MSVTSAILSSPHTGEAAIIKTAASAVARVLIMISLEVVANRYGWCGSRCHATSPAVSLRRAPFSTLWHDADAGLALDRPRGCEPVWRDSTLAANESEPRL